MALNGKNLSFTDILLSNDRVARVNSAGKLTCPPDWRWDTSPGLPDYDVLCILGGKGVYRGPGSACEVSSGSALLLRPGERWIGSMDRRHPMTVIYVHFDLLDSSGGPLRPVASDAPAAHRVLESPDFFAGTLDRLLETFRDGDGAGASLWLRAALRELVRQERRPRWQGAELARAETVERLKTMMRERPAADWSPPRLASIACCSTDHLFRLFRKYAGTTPGAYLIGVRMGLASSLLRTSSMSVGEIAEAVGYADIFTFSRQFKRSMGTSPRGYRTTSG